MAREISPGCRKCAPTVQDQHDVLYGPIICIAMHDLSAESSMSISGLGTLDALMCSLSNYEHTWLTLCRSVPAQDGLC